MRSNSLTVASSDIVLQAVPGALDMPDEFVRIPDAARRRHEQELVQQSAPFRRCYRLTLFNGHYLDCQQPQGGSRVVNLAYLAEEPLIVRENAWRWLVAGLVAFAGVTVTSLFAQLPESLALGVFAALCLVMYFALSRTRLIFRTRFGGIAVFELHHRMWNRRHSLDFARLLQERIRGAAVVLPKGDQRLAAEIAEHRRMLMEGWLSRSRYELAKKRIFSRYRRAE